MKKKYFFKVLFLLLVMLPIHEKISTLLVFPLFILSLTSFGFSFNNLLKKYSWFIILYLLFIISSLRPNFVFEPYILEKKALFLITPVIFHNITLQKDIFFKLLKGFVIGCFIALLITIFTSFFLNNSLIIKYITNYQKADIFFKFFKWYFTHEAIYLSMYLNLAFYALLIYKKQLKFNAIFYWCALILIFFFLVEISSVIGIFLVLFIGALIGLRLILKASFLKLFLGLLILIVGIVIGSGLINPNIIGFRYYTWKNSITIIKDNWLLGLGNKLSDKLLNNLYYQDYLASTDIFVYLNSNSHNQYFQFLIEGGILMFLTFCIFIYKIYKISPIQIDIRLIFIIIIVFTSIGECIFNRYLGVSFFCFFYCLIYSSFNKRLN